MWIKPPPLPREHGAWAMLAVALALGLSAAWPHVGPALPVVPGMLLLFLARSAAVPAAARVVAGKTAPREFLRRRWEWAVLYLAGGAVFLGSAVVLAGPSARRAAIAAASVTAVLGTAHTLSAVFGRDRTVGGEIIGMTALASSAVLVQACAGVPLDLRALSVGALALAYFLSVLVFVRAFQMLPGSPGAAIGGCLVAHLVLGAALAGLWVAGLLPPGGVVAFVPVVLRGVLGLGWPPRNVRALGFRELGVSVVFVLVAAAALLA